MQALADKAVSRVLAKKAGVATPPGSDGVVEKEQDALTIAKRIGYPVITWLFSAGQRALVPWMLVVVNVAAIGALAWLGGHLAQQGGRHAAWGLLLPDQRS